MSEIEKMYENAGVKKQIPKVCSSNELYCKECKAHIEDAMPYCKNAEYPPFTAEKQLELIKWLSKKQYVYIIMSADKEYYLCADNSFISGYNKQFDKALAMFVNSYWQDLTVEEKQQIKEILQ